MEAIKKVSKYNEKAGDYLDTLFENRVAAETIIAQAHDWWTGPQTSTDYENLRRTVLVTSRNLFEDDAVFKSLTDRRRILLTVMSEFLIVRYLDEQGMTSFSDACKIIHKMRKIYEPWFTKDAEYYEQNFKLHDTDTSLSTDTSTPKETNMNFNLPAVELRTFIFGEQARDLSDNEIFAAINSIELNIEVISRTKTKPAKLKAKIEALQSQVEELVKYVDSRS
jgi:hypothetical protein